MINMIFSQLLDLIMGSDWTTYFAEFGKENGTYVRVKPTTAIAVMEKYDFRDYWISPWNTDFLPFRKCFITFQN